MTLCLSAAVPMHNDFDFIQIDLISQNVAMIYQLSSFYIFMNLWAPLSYSKLRGQLFFLKRSSILEIFNNLVIVISNM